MIIQSIVFKHTKHSYSLLEIQEAWEDRSEDWSASWLMIDGYNCNQIFKDIKPFLPDRSP